MMYFRGETVVFLGLMKDWNLTIPTQFTCASFLYTVPIMKSYPSTICKFLKKVGPCIIEQVTVREAFFMLSQICLPVAICFYWPWFYTKKYIWLLFSLTALQHSRYLLLSLYFAKFSLFIATYLIPSLQFLSLWELWLSPSIWSPVGYRIPGAFQLALKTLGYLPPVF